MSKIVCVLMLKDLFAEKWQGLKEKFANRNCDIVNCSGQNLQREKCPACLESKVLAMTMKVIAKIDLHSFHFVTQRPFEVGGAVFVHTVAQIGSVELFFDSRYIKK